MSDDLPIRAGTAGSRMKLEESERALEEILTALNEMSGRIGQGEDIAPTEISKMRVALSFVRAQLLEEVTKHEKRVLASEGFIADAPIDFDEIKDTIGERLDRIRDANQAV